MGKLIKPLVLTAIISWMFGIDSFWMISAICLVAYIMIPEWEKDENEFQKDIKEGNDLKKWYAKFPHRARHHQAKQEMKRWIGQK